MIKGVRALAAASLMAALGLSTMSTASAEDRTAASTNTLIPEQYIVTLKPGSNAAGPVRQTAQALLGRVGGGQLLQVYQHSIDGFAVRLPAVAARALSNSPLVARIEQDRRMELSATQFDAGYNIDRLDQPSLPLDDTYSYASAGLGVNVYVIDTGLNASHVDFAGRIASGRNFAANSTGGLLCVLLGRNCPVPDPVNTDDCNGHGTHVSGTAMGTTYGVAKGATVVPVRVFGCGNSTSTSTIIAGVDWVAGNASLPAVANMSLGGGVSATLDDAVSNLITQGVTVVMAAGNEDADACGSSPGRVTAGITVAATDASDTRASYSNFGSCVDLFAPGSNVVSASNTDDTGTNTYSGTSMASPLVAGAAARYLSTAPGASPAQVESFLEGSASAGLVADPAGSPNLLIYLPPGL